MTPVEDSQISEELLGGEENRFQIRVRNVSELNNSEAEASESTALPIKRRCLPSWMLSSQGSSTNKKKKEENKQQPESTVSSASTSNAQKENENDDSSNQNTDPIDKRDENSKVESSGALELNHEDITEQNNNEECVTTNSDSSARAEAVQMDGAESNAVTCSASISNQTPASSKDSIKTEPNQDDNEAVGHVTTVPSPKDIKLAVKVEKEEATSSTSRICCRYGIRCYRQNPMHRREEAHPGDTDYRRPDYPLPVGDNVPNCPYGDLCYRRNPAHFQQYTHPPSTDGKQNRKTHARNLRDRKKCQLPKPNEDFDDEEGDFSWDSSEELNFDTDDGDNNDTNDFEDDEDGEDDI